MNNDLHGTPEPDRLYTTNDAVVEPSYLVYNFKTRIVRTVSEHPQPEGDTLFPPFYVDPVTFWAIVGRIRQLDEFNFERVSQRDRERERQFQAMQAIQERNEHT